MPIRNLLPSEVITIASEWGKITGNIESQTDLIEILDDKSDNGHNHDSAYSALSHNHDGIYSGLNHNHDNDYSPLEHNHNEEYSVINHNHNNLYSLLGHNHLNYNAETLTGSKTLSSGDNEIQFLNPNGANRDVNFPTTGVTAGQLFRIKNTATYTTSYYLNIKENGSVIEKIYPGGSKYFIWDGSAWKGNSIGTIDQNVMIGAQALAKSGGVAIGVTANADIQGTSIGGNSNGSNYGCAVGVESNGANATAIGYYSNANSKAGSIALGRYAKCERTGELVKTSDSNNKYVLSIAQWFRETTDGNQTEIFLAGVSNARYTVLANSSIFFEIRAIARNNGDNKTKAWQLTGSIQRDGSNNTALIGSITKTIISDSGVSWDISAEADDTNEALIIKVTGETGKTIRWEAVCFNADVRF